jgi:hypothetical protein
MKVIGYIVYWSDPTYRDKTSVSKNKCHDEDGSSKPLILAADAADELEALEKKWKNMAGRTDSLIAPHILEQCADELLALAVELRNLR